MHDEVQGQLVIVPLTKQEEDDDDDDIDEAFELALVALSGSVVFELVVDDPEDCDG